MFILHPWFTVDKHHLLKFYTRTIFRKSIGAPFLGGPLLYSDFSIKLDYLGQHGELAGVSNFYEGANFLTFTNSTVPGWRVHPRYTPYLLVKMALIVSWVPTVGSLSPFELILKIFQCNPLEGVLVFCSLWEVSFVYSQSMVKSK